MSINSNEDSEISAIMTIPSSYMRKHWQRSNLFTVKVVENRDTRPAQNPGCMHLDTHALHHFIAQLSTCGCGRMPLNYCWVKKWSYAAYSAWCSLCKKKKKKHKLFTEWVSRHIFKFIFHRTRSGKNC